jgi:hypothetical protein
MRSSPRSNPFVYSRPVRPDEAAPRHDDARHLVDLAEGGHNATLIAPRRYGKTSLLNQVRQEAEDAGMLTVLVDLSDVLSIADVAARLDLAFRSVRGPLGRFVSDHLATIGLTLPFQMGGITAGRPATAPDPVAAVHHLLEVPVHLHRKSGRRVLVALDEFQALAALQGMDGVFRSHLQHQGEAASFLFAGSEPTMLRTMFADRARPLYGQAEIVPLTPLADEPAAELVRSRFAMTRRDPGEALLPLVRVAEGHPQRLMLLAHHLWAGTAADRPANLRTLRSAFETTMRRVEPELRFLWDGLPANERRVLRALASGLSPMTTAGMELAGLTSRSSAQTALRSLVDAGVVQRDENEIPTVVDPLLVHWTRRHAGAQPTVYVVPDPAQRGAFLVADGPSLALVQRQAATIGEAEQLAERILAGRGGTIVVHESDDPNELPVWAVGVQPDGA